MQADSTAAKETFVHSDPEITANISSHEVPTYDTHDGSKQQETGVTPDHHSGHHKSENQPSGHSEPKPKAGHTGHNGHHATVVETNDMEVFRHTLVNNYRPVQPLNGRTVYRSFPFFDQPHPSMAKSKSDVVIKEPEGSSSTVTLSMLSLTSAVLMQFL